MKLIDVTNKGFSYEKAESKEVAKMYRQGKNITEIAVILGINHTKIRKYLARKGIPIRHTLRGMIV